MEYFYKLVVVGRNLFRHELISGSLFLFVGGLIGSFLSFLYNLFLARTLTQADYGTYTSLLSFETLIIIPSVSLTAVVVRFATHYFAKNEKDKAAHLFKKMSLIWLAIGASIGGAIYLLNPILLSYLHLEDPFLIFLVALAIGIAYAGVVNTGFLQSLTRFSVISLLQVIGNIAKLAVGGFLVFAGSRTSGALIGILATPVVMYFLSFWPLRSLFRAESSSEETFETKEILNYALLAALGIISLSSFISTDVILVKHFFNGTQAGLYGGLSIIGKVLFYFTAPISAVMFPLIVKKHTTGQNYKNIYFLAMFLVLAPSLMITVFYFVFPQFTANFFLGNRYLEVAPYLGLFGVFLTLFNLLNISVNFFLSLKKTSVSFLVLIFALLQIILIYMFHSDFYQVIYSSIASVSLLLLTLMLYYKFQKV